MHNCIRYIYVDCTGYLVRKLGDLGYWIAELIRIYLFTP